MVSYWIINSFNYKYVYVYCILYKVKGRSWYSRSSWSKGPRGPRGDPGKCTSSDKCGIEDCEEKMYNIASNYYPSISISCLKDNARCTDKELESARPVTKQVKQLITECKKTSRAEEDFIARIRPIIANMEKQ